MENMNYYPLRVGKHSSCIVSDRIPTRNGLTSYSKSDLDYEYDQYGGFIIAESIPSGIAQALVDAYNEKYGCTSKDKPCTGGNMCCQSKISHHEWVEQENKLSGHSFTEGMDNIGRKTICTQPNCDCIKQAEKKAGGPVKRYECLARPGFEYIPYPDSGHSFTEGMEMDSISNDKSVFEPNQPTIDDQIAFMKNSRHSILGSDDAIYTAIIENLKAIKRWNETPVYHGEIDVANVIEDLVAMSYTTNSAADFAVLNGHKAIEMINRFKEEREAPEWIKKHAHVTTRPLTPKDVAEAHHAGVNILNRKAMYEYIPQKERDQLVDQIKRDLFSVFEGRSHKLANTIIFAIEQMDHLKRKHGR